MTVLYKRFAIITYDLLTIPFAWCLAFWVRVNLTTVPMGLLHQALQLLPLVCSVQIFIFWFLGLYRGEWRFASIPDLIRIIKAVVLGSLIIFVSIYLLQNHLPLPPRSIFPLYVLLQIFLLGGARLFYRWWKEYRQLFREREKRVLIIGAGLAGESLLRDLFRDTKKRYFPVGFVDDNRGKKGTEILGVRVLGHMKDIPVLVKKYAVDLVLIAIPSATGKLMQQIVEHCHTAQVDYRTLPSLNALASGEVTVNDLRSVSLEDLLGREPIDLHDSNLTQAFQSKVVLVTGGGGSIGSELCRQLAEFNVSELVIFDHAEYNLYAIEHELRHKHPHLKLACYLQDVTDQPGVLQHLLAHHPHVVFHAAAYKHVPLLECQPAVAVHNNLQGTRIMAEAAAQCQVEKFVLISTDKAVNPANVMGTTKRLAEIFCQNFNEQVSTKFITVRFGNVLGSAGSVIPLFKKQLEAGGPITVTHPEITRFFMTIPEASQLILQASLLGKGGEIFVLDMGEPIKIRDLAEQMIQLAGKKLGDDIDIVFTGLRPGEKLYEELFHDKEPLQGTPHAKILRAQARLIDWPALQQALVLFHEAAQKNDLETLKKLFREWVPEHQMR